MLELIERKEAYMGGYKAYCQAFYDCNILTFQPTNPAAIDDGWFQRTKEWYDKKAEGLIEHQPKSIHYWAVEGDRFIGEFQLRPELNEAIMNGIGSIGYSVTKSEWGRGYGKQILKLGLELAKAQGLQKVFLIINSDNLRSCAVCESNGGRLYDEIILTSDAEGSRQVKRYWIYL